MKKAKTLYAIITIMFVLITIPPISILVGLKIFSTESIFVLAMGLPSKATIYLPISQIIGFIIVLFLSGLLNKIIKEITKPYDDLLDVENKTVVTNYERFKIEKSYFIPVVITFILGLFSYYNIYKNSGTGLVLIIFSGVLEGVISFVVFYNNMQFLNFLQQNKKEE